MARVPGYKTFWEMAGDAAKEHKRGGHWLLHRDDYFNRIVHDFWDRLFADGTGPKKIFSLSVGSGPAPETITPDPRIAPNPVYPREFAWGLLGMGRPAAFNQYWGQTLPPWNELAKVPTEDYGDGARDTLKSLCLSADDARAWIEANPNYGGLTGNTRSRGGKRPKYNIALQKIINHVRSKIISDGKKVTLGTVIKWVEDNASEGVPIELGIPDCDGVFVQGQKLLWKDHGGNDCGAVLRSLEPYIVRANNPK